MKKFKHTLAKLSRTGTLIGRKYPTIQVNWILDLLAKETCLAKQKSHKWALVRCCVSPICLQEIYYHYYLLQFQGSEGHFDQIGVKIKSTTPTNLAEGKSIACHHHDFAAKHSWCKMLHSASFFLSLKENWSDSVDTLRSFPCLILCWNEK